MTDSDLTLIYHAACFDGVASAGVFSAFAREHLGVRKVSLARDDYGAGPLDVSLLGPVSAVVDFKFSSDPRVVWWADHHSAGGAIGGASEREAYETRRSDPKIIFEPGAPSCTGLLVRELAARFGWNSSRFAGLGAEADTIDAAGYKTLGEALDITSAPARIALALEHRSTAELERDCIAGLARGRSDEATTTGSVGGAIDEAVARFDYQRRVLTELATIEGGVLEADLSETDIARPHKFLPYSLYDDVAFNVTIVRLPTGVAVKCGRNFWHPISDRLPSVGAICQEWGGGGHEGAGGIPIPGGQVERARQTAKEVAWRLRAFVARARRGSGSPSR